LVTASETAGWFRVAEFELVSTPVVESIFISAMVFAPWLLTSR